MRRVTPAKAARVGAIPLHLAVIAIDRLTGPDADAYSGVAEGRRLLPDPDGGPNDFIVTNWEHYGQLFARANAADRQRRQRERTRESDEGVTESRSRHAHGGCHAKRDGGRDLEKREKTTKTNTGSHGLPADVARAFEEDLASLRSVARTARRGRVKKLWLDAVAREGLDGVRAAVSRGVTNYAAALRADRSRGFDRQPKEDATLLGELLAGDWQDAAPAAPGVRRAAPLSDAVVALAQANRQGAHQ